MTAWTDETELIAAQAIGVAGAAVTDQYSAARRVLTALADLGLLVEPGGESHTVWRCYDLVSGGAYVTYSREELERHCTDTRAHEPDPLGPPPHPSEHQTAQHTVWPDGSQHTGPWRPTSSEEPT